MLIKTGLLLLFFIKIVSNSYNMKSIANVSSEIYGTYIDNNGAIYYSASDNNVIYKMNGVDGVPEIFAGTFGKNGTFGDSGDGNWAVDGVLFYPAGIIGDSAGNIYFVDDCYARKVNADGIISTVAGYGPCSLNGNNYTGDGIANQTALLDPFDIAVDLSGNVIIGDEGGSRIVYVNSGLMRTFHNFSYCSPAVNPITGDVYISSFIGNQIFKVNVTTGDSTILVGNGTAALSPDGPIYSNTTLNAPYYIRFIPGTQQIIFAETGSKIVRVIDILANTLTTVAGTGNTSPPTLSETDSLKVNIFNPWAVSASSDGSFVVTESNYGVKKSALNVYYATSSKLWIIAAVLLPIFFVAFIIGIILRCLCRNKKGKNYNVEYTKPKDEGPNSQPVNTLDVKENNGKGRI